MEPDVISEMVLPFRSETGCRDADAADCGGGRRIPEAPQVFPVPSDRVEAFTVPVLTVFPETVV